MKISINSLAIAAVFSLSANAQQAPAPDPFQDPTAAQENRRMVHKLMATYTNDMAAMFMGKKQFDGYKLMVRADAVHQLSKSYFEFFMVPGSYEGSNANPAILNNAGDFKDQIRATEIAAFGMQTAIRNRDPKASKAAFGNLMNSCQQCHQTYMTQR